MSTQTSKAALRSKHQAELVAIDKKGAWQKTHVRHLCRNRSCWNQRLVLRKPACMV